MKTASLQPQWILPCLLLSAYRIGSGVGGVIDGATSALGGIADRFSEPRDCRRREGRYQWACL